MGNIHSSSHVLDTPYKQFRNAHPDLERLLYFILHDLARIDQSSASPIVTAVHPLNPFQCFSDGAACTRFFSSIDTIRQDLEAACTTHEFHEHCNAVATFRWVQDICSTGPQPLIKNIANFRAAVRDPSISVPSDFLLSFDDWSHKLTSLLDIGSVLLASARAKAAFGLPGSSTPAEIDRAPSSRSAPTRHSSIGQSSRGSKRPSTQPFCSSSRQSSLRAQDAAVVRHENEERGEQLSSADQRSAVLLQNASTSTVDLDAIDEKSEGSSTQEKKINEVVHALSATTEAHPLNHVVHDRDAYRPPVPPKLDAFNSRPSDPVAVQAGYRRSPPISPTSSGVGRTTKFVTTLRNAPYIRVICDGIAEPLYLGPFIVILAIAYGVVVAIWEVRPDLHAMSPRIADSFLLAIAFLLNVFPLVQRDESLQKHLFVYVVTLAFCILAFIAAWVLWHHDFDAVSDALFRANALLLSLGVTWWILGASYGKTRQQRRLSVGGVENAHRADPVPRPNPIHHADHRSYGKIRASTSNEHADFEMRTLNYANASAEQLRPALEPYSPLPLRHVN